MVRQKEEFNDRVKVVIYLIGYAILLAFISEVLFLLNPETVIQNWGIGLIFSTLFAFFYIVDSIELIIFKMDRMNKWLFYFWFGWLISDYQDFLILLYNLITTGGA